MAVVPVARPYYLVTKAEFLVMPRHVIIALLIVSIASSTMAVGCIGGLGGGGGIAAQIAIVAAQFFGSLLLSDFITSLSGGDGGDDEAFTVPVAVVAPWYQAPSAP